MRLSNNRSDRTDTIGETVVKRRREGRGWGPFTGGQLTIIIVALATVLGFPVAAFAVVSGTKTFITDATTGARAKVTSTGQLQTHPNGPLTINGAVGVSGAVTATPAAPKALYAGFSGNINVGSCTSVATPPAGKALVLTSVHVDIADPAFPTPTYPNFYVLYTGTSCPGTAVPIDQGTFTLTTHSPVIPFASGLPIANGSHLWAYTGDAATVSVSGYLVPAAACTGGCY